MHRSNIRYRKTVVLIVYSEKIVYSGFKCNRFGLIHFLLAFNAELVFEDMATRAMLKLGFEKGGRGVAGKGFHF